MFVFSLMEIPHTGHKLTDEDVEDMISGADLDGDGRIDYDGARPFLSSRSHPLQFTILTTFVMQSFSWYMQFALFLRISWSLIVIGADDAANVIMPPCTLASQIGVKQLAVDYLCAWTETERIQEEQLISCVFGSRSSLCLFLCRFMTLVLYIVIVRLHPSLQPSAITHSANGLV
jgi:hypothetical protein